MLFKEDWGYKVKCYRVEFANSRAEILPWIFLISKAYSIALYFKAPVFLKQFHQILWQLGNKWVASHCLALKSIHVLLRGITKIVKANHFLFNLFMTFKVRFQMTRQLSNHPYRPLFRNYIWGLWRGSKVPALYFRLPYQHVPKRVGPLK